MWYEKVVSNSSFTSLTYCTGCTVAKFKLYLQSTHGCYAWEIKLQRVSLCNANSNDAHGCHRYIFKNFKKELFSICSGIFPAFFKLLRREFMSTEWINLVSPVCSHTYASCDTNLNHIFLYFMNKQGITNNSKQCNPNRPLKFSFHKVYDQSRRFPFPNHHQPNTNFKEDTV